jgi:hypothetical protein
MITSGIPKYPEGVVDEMCTCGHPQTHHDCAGHNLDDGRFVVVVGHGPCALGESTGDPEQMCKCEKYTFKDWIYKGDENYERFKYLYEDV